MANVNKGTFFPIYVDTNDVCVDNNPASEVYGDWSETWDCEIDHVFVDERGYCKEIPVGFKPVKGMKVFVVTQSYSDGDSFGRREGLMRIIGVFNTQFISEKVRQAVKDGYESSQSLVECQIENGNVCRYSLDVDYFLIIDDIRIESFVVE